MTDTAGPAAPRGRHRPRGTRLRGLTDAGNRARRAPPWGEVAQSEGTSHGGTLCPATHPGGTSPTNVRRKCRAWPRSPGSVPSPTRTGAAGPQDRPRREGLLARVASPRRGTPRRHARRPTAHACDGRAPGRIWSPRRPLLGRGGAAGPGWTWQSRGASLRNPITLSPRPAHTHAELGTTRGGSRSRDAHPHSARRPSSENHGPRPPPAFCAAL